MLTIGQLAKHTGCTVKAVRVYHARGLLPEPVRDHSGYRRYDAQAVIDLTRVVTLAKAGVPLADIPKLLASSDDEYHTAIADIDARLTERIVELDQRRIRLSLLETPTRLCLPEQATTLLEHLKQLGFSEHYITIERDSCILGAATMPAVIDAYLPIKIALLEDPDYLRVIRAYDGALTWQDDDPRIDDLARQTLAISERITLPGNIAAIHDLAPDVLDTATAYQGNDAPAWRALAERTRHLASRVEPSSIARTI